MQTTIAHEWDTELIRQQKAGDGRIAKAVDGIRAAVAGTRVLGDGDVVPLRPVVLSASEQARLYRSAARIARLAVEVARTLIRNDYGALAELVRSDEHDPRLFTHGLHADLAPLSCRPDVLYQGGEPRVFELNFDSVLSGTTAVPALTTAYLGTPVGRQLRGSVPLFGYDFFAGRARLIAKAARALHVRRAPQVVILGIGAEGYEGSMRFFEDEADYLSAHGMPCVWLEPEEVAVEDGYIASGKRRFDVAIRNLMIDRALRTRRDALVRFQIEARHTGYITGYVSRLFSSKRLLASLYEKIETMSSGDASMVRRYVPWTWNLKEGFARRDDSRFDLLPWVIKNRRSLVLKPYNLAAGNGVVVGSLVGSDSWQESVEAALAGGACIVQEHCEPDRFRIPFYHMAEKEINIADVPAVLGPFLMAGGPAGCIVRHPRSAESGGEFVDWTRKFVWNVTLGH